MEAVEHPTPATGFTITASLRKSLATRLTNEQLDLFDQAVDYSNRAHAGQSRASGQPFITHPITVASVLNEWEMDHQAIIAAILHDSIEDTSVTLQLISERFGGSIATLVDGVSKIEKIESQAMEVRQAENFRKILLAISKDWRVIFIKLADRLHNIKTLSHITNRDKRKRIARETLEIYAPIADRLGMSSVCRELENLSFRHLYPHRFRVLSKALKHSGGHHRKALDRLREQIVHQLKEHEINAIVSGREKNLFSIYKKMVAKHLSFSDVEDIMGFRIIVKDRLACYRALGVLHMFFQPIPTKFDDYIAVPKSNGYQSLHTTVKERSGVTLELQIRTESMHAFAEQGLAAHWLYKRSSDNVGENVQMAANQRLQSLIDLYIEPSNPHEFLENVKIDLYPDESYIMTPKGVIITVPKNSTALDFAYTIHSDLGNKASFVRINGKPMPLSTRLSTGDVVEVVTSSERSTPLPHWLGFVTTAKARSQIRNKLRMDDADQAGKLGKQLLIVSLNKLDSSIEKITEDQWNKFFKGKPFASHDDLHKEIGLGKLSSDLIAYSLMTMSGEKAKKKTVTEVPPIAVGGTLTSATRFADCCHPLPGESIVGLIHKGRGLTIHRHDCPELHAQKGNSAWLDVDWDEKAEKRHYIVPLRIQCVNRPGITSTVFSLISSDNEINIEGFRMQDGKLSNQHVTIDVTVEVNSLSRCRALLGKLRAADEVVTAERISVSPSSTQSPF